MSEANETKSASEPERSRSVTETERTHSALSRVLNLSIFFVGIGVFSAVGFGLRHIGLFSPLQLTYFTVGMVVGVVGLLLALMTR